MYYGPQSQDPAATPLTVVLQMGGASGSGYLSRKEVKAGMDALGAEGEFKDGVFRRFKDVSGKRNVDGYQAIWEYVNKRPMDYPKPRYSRPFMMDPSHYEWTEVDGAPGVAEKLLGVFTERRSTARMLRLDPGAVYDGEGRSIFFVIEGQGTVAGEPLLPLTTVYLVRREHARFTARETTRLLHLGLPDLSGLAAGRTSVTAAAAE
jgi:hypothetical protein